MKTHKNKGLNICFSWKDTGFTLLILLVASILSFSIQQIDKGDMVVPMIFVLAIMLISRVTGSWIYGALSSVLAVFLVNFAFTFPYFEFNFTITGYPITFLTMFTVSVMTGMLTSQIKQQERIKREIEEETMRANLLRAVSHDIRTPLTSIMGSADAYLENADKLSEKDKRALIAEVKDDASWLIRVVENLLSVTRINEGKTRLQKTEELAEEILGGAVQKLKKNYPDAPVSTFLPDEILFVPMDGVLIEQVLMNLLENCMVHGGDFTKIELSLRREGESAVFTVEDDGCGIDPQILPIIFDGYQHHAETTESDRKRNMGIGLSVCSSIIKAHGGIMTAENRKEGGAKFSFYLPMKEE